MSPHKHDPKFRKVDVDLSAILTRSGESDRPTLTDQAANPYFVVAQGARPIDESRSPIGLPGLVNILFTISACVVGLLCAPFAFNNSEDFRSPSYGSEDARYARIDSMANAPEHLFSQVSALRAFPHFPQSKLHLLPNEEGAQSNWNQNPFAWPPFSGPSQFSSLQNDVGVNANGLKSNPLRPTGSGSPSMSENAGSSSQSESSMQKATAGMSKTRARNARRQAQGASLFPPKKILGSGANSVCRLLSSTQNGTSNKPLVPQSRSATKLNIGDGPQPRRPAQNGLSHAAMNNSIGATGFAAMQNRAEGNAMHMQATILSQGAFHGGGGLGGFSGSAGNGPVAARR